MKRLVLVALLLAGCNSTPKEPIVVTREVKVPVPVPAPPCTSAVEQPAGRFDALPLTANIFEITRALLADREAGKGEKARLRACP